jgi:hypothetical protein
LTNPLAGCAWGRKWDGRWRYEVGDGGFEHEHGRALVFEVQPTKVFAFGKGTFSQTRHRFAPGQPGEHVSMNRLLPRP